VNQKMAPRTPPQLPPMKARRSPRHNDSSGRDHSSSCQNEKSKKSKKDHTPGPKTNNFHKCQNEDPLAGDPQWVSGTPMNRTQIDKEVAPDKMRRSDQAIGSGKHTHRGGVDVTSLQVEWNSNKGVSVEELTSLSALNPVF
jgi:hypothetical protein